MTLAVHRAVDVADWWPVPATTLGHLRIADFLATTTGLGGRTFGVDPDDRSTAHLLYRRLGYVSVQSSYAYRIDAARGGGAPSRIRRQRAPGSRSARVLFAGFHGDGQPVLGRGDGARREVRERARQVGRPVEVERHRAVLVRGVDRK